MLLARVNGLAYLILSVAGEAANTRLDCTSGRVHVGLKGGGVVVRHIWML